MSVPTLPRFRLTSSYVLEITSVKTAPSGYTAIGRIERVWKDPLPVTVTVVHAGDPTRRLIQMDVAGEPILFTAGDMAGLVSLLEDLAGDRPKIGRPPHSRRVN